MRAFGSEIGIGITTRDRWGELEATLEHLQASGLDTLETLVVDDGSITPMPEAFHSRFPWVRFERCETSRGLIAQRNHIVRNLKAPFYLSLDDDSFPVSGSLDDAAAWMKAHPRVAVIGFQILLKDFPDTNAGIERSPVPTRDFTGCGFLLRRDLFLSLGGFEERFHMYCEEMEFSLRAYRAGYEIYYYPGVLVRHRLSRQGRHDQPRTYLLIRNHVLTALWFYPFPFSLMWSLWWSGMKNPFPGEQALRIRRTILLGAIEGWFRFFQWPAKERLSYSQLQDWRAKPFIASLDPVYDPH